MTVTQKDLGLQPIDLLYILSDVTQPALAELDDRALLHVIQAQNPRPDATLRIDYTRKAADLTTFTFFELMPLVASLRKLALSSSPLKATDVMLPVEAQPEQDATETLDRARVATAHSTVTALRGDLTTYQAALEPLLDDLATHRADVLSGIDDFADDLIALLERASRSGIPQTGWGFITQRRGGLYARLLDAVETLVARWTERLAAFDAAMTEFDARLARRPTPSCSTADPAERWVATQAENPLPPTPAAFRALLDAKRDAMQDRLDDFDALLSASHSLAGLLAAVQALLPVTAFDPDEFPIAAHEDEVILFANDLLGLAIGLGRTWTGGWQRRRRSLTRTTQQPKPPGGSARCKRARRRCLARTSCWSQSSRSARRRAWNGKKRFNAQRRAAEPPDRTLGVDFPVDDWLYGAARVREKLHTGSAW